MLCRAPEEYKSANGYCKNNPSNSTQEECIFCSSFFDSHIESILDMVKSYKYQTLEQRKNWKAKTLFFWQCIHEKLLFSYYEEFICSCFTGSLSTLLGTPYSDLDFFTIGSKKFFLPENRSIAENIRHRLLLFLRIQFYVHRLTKLWPVDGGGINITKVVPVNAITGFEEFFIGSTSGIYFIYRKARILNGDRQIFLDFKNFIEPITNSKNKEFGIEFMHIGIEFMKKFEKKSYLKITSFDIKSDFIRPITMVIDGLACYHQNYKKSTIKNANFLIEKKFFPEVLGYKVLGILNYAISLRNMNHETYKKEYDVVQKKNMEKQILVCMEEFRKFALQLEKKYPILEYNFKDLFYLWKL